MRAFATLCCLLVLASVPAGARQSRHLTVESANPDRRTALVIGNAAYEVAPLKNPVHDARDMARALGALGFEVIHRENLNQIEMKRAIREFGAKIRQGGVGLFYYAGHGVQVKGVNYLVPVGAKVDTEEEVEYESVDAGFVLAQMETARNAMNIMILDACRNNPFARSFRSASRGLAQMDAPSGSLIAYATAPGSVASDGDAQNGLYTQELLKFMRTPGLSIEEVFKRVRISVRQLTQDRQTPWESSSLIGNFSFAAGDAAPRPAHPQPSAGVDSIAVELAFWDTIKNSRDPEDYRAYLRRYPDGEFAIIARRRVQTAASPPTASPTPQPPAATPTPAAEADAEQAVLGLKALGTGRLDIGRFGEDFVSVDVISQCRVRFEERSLWNSKARFKPTVLQTFAFLPDINVASIGVSEMKPPDRPPVWIVTARTVQGRTFTMSMTVYENRNLEKVKVPTKTENPTAAYVGAFMDSESANRYAKAFAAAARSCGAKSEMF